MFVGFRAIANVVVGLMLAFDVACNAGRAFDEPKGGGDDFPLATATEQLVQLLSWWAPIGDFDPVEAMVAVHKHSRDVVLPVSSRVQRRKSELLDSGAVVLGIVGLLPPQVYNDVNWTHLGDVAAER